MYGVLWAKWLEVDLIHPQGSLLHHLTLQPVARLPESLARGLKPSRRGCSGHV